MFFRLPVVRFFNRVINRATVTVALVLLQIGWLLWAFFSLTAGKVWVNAGLNVLSLFITLYLVRKDENSDYKIIWLVLIGMMPLLGGALYLAFGNKRPAKRLRLKMQAVEDAHKKDLVQEPGVLEGLDAREQGQSRYVAKYGPYPAWQNTCTQYFACGEAMYPQLLADLEKAEKSIFLEFFIVSHGCMWNGIEKILRRKAAAGLDVRVIYDDAGCLSLLPHNYAELLRAEGIRAFSFNRCVPVLNLVMNNRDHRKIMVIDGKIGFTGGINLSDEYINRTSRLGHWKDTAIALRGDAVRSLTLMFLQMWDVSSVHFTPEVYSKYLDVPQPAHEKEAGYVIPYGDSPLDRDLVGEMVYMDIINRANRYVHIMTPYLIIDNEMITALTYAARRGVEVQLILPHVPDKEIAFSLAHTYYRRLLENGVQIYEYEPGFGHAKVFVSDDCKATVGTINLDYRSLYHHFECGTYLYASPEVPKIEQDFQQTLAKCVRADAELLKNDPFMRKLIGPGMRIIAPLL